MTIEEATSKVLFSGKYDTLNMENCKLNQRWKMFELAEGVINGHIDLEDAYLLAKKQNAENDFRDAYLRGKGYSLQNTFSAECVFNIITVIVVIFAFLGLIIGR